MKNGFTLIELLTVIGILGILMGLGVPGFQTLSQNNQLEMRQSIFMQHLLLARSEAAERKRRITICGTTNPSRANPICANNSWGTGWVVFEDDSAGVIGTFQAANDTVLERFIPEDTRVTVATTNTIRRSITFLPDGTVDNGGGFGLSETITLRDNRQPNDCGLKSPGRRCISIARTGRARPE